jgi:hypothetical protein
MIQKSGVFSLNPELFSEDVGLATCSSGPSNASGFHEEVENHVNVSDDTPAVCDKPGPSNINKTAQNSEEITKRRKDFYC